MFEWKLSLVYDLSLWMIVPPDSSIWIKLFVSNIIVLLSFITQLFNIIDGLVSLLINRGWF
jgi:hypothetical protein